MHNEMAVCITKRQAILKVDYKVSIEYYVVEENDL